MSAKNCFYYSTIFRFFKGFFGNLQLVNNFNCSGSAKFSFLFRINTGSVDPLGKSGSLLSVHGIYFRTLTKNSLRDPSENSKHDRLAALPKNRAQKQKKAGCIFGFQREAPGKRHCRAYRNFLWCPLESRV